MNNRIGAMASLRTDKSCFAELCDFGLRACQLASWNPSIWATELAGRVREDARKKKVKVTSLWAGWQGPQRWDLIDGPRTLGLVPAAYRWARVETMLRAGEFAKELGVPAVITHLGFIPEDPGDPVFREVVIAVRHVAESYKAQGLEFWFETGQETPVTVLRLIEAVGTGNLGINLDPANLILYGKGNPIDALDVFGKHVRNVHAKDGMYPTDPMQLGREVKVGEGRVRFPEFVRRLEEIGFKGEYIIEREISGEQQKKDIAATVKYLEGLLSKEAAANKR
jgi:sugar phosphate isomerase/epimerase